MDYLQISQKSVHLQCVFHSIRFKVNKGWSKALLLFLCLYVYTARTPYCFPKQPNITLTFYKQNIFHSILQIFHTFAPFFNFIHQNK
ncbi:hypothetical protein HC965_07425 [Bacteroides sp. GM023]|nr:hypothetical protein [Bacteroides sp. GM023]